MDRLITTVAGKEDIAQSIIGAKKLQWLNFKIGTGVPTETELADPVYQGEIESVKILNRNEAVFRMHIPADEGPYSITEAAIYNENGDAMAINVYDPAIPKLASDLGKVMDVLLEFRVIVADTTALTLMIDPSSVYVTMLEFLNLEDRVIYLEDKLIDLEPRVRALETTLDGVAEFLEAKV